MCRGYLHRTRKNRSSGSDSRMAYRPAMTGVRGEGFSQLLGEHYFFFTRNRQELFLLLASGDSHEKMQHQFYRFCLP